MRTLFVASAYAAADARAKLRALAGLGHTVGAAIPERAGADAGADDLGVHLFPIPVRGSPGRRVWDSRALRRAVSGFGPDLVQIEEEPWTRAAGGAAAIAKRQRVPTVQYTSGAASGSLTLVERRRQGRTLGRAAAIAAANEPAATQARAIRPDAPIVILPQLGIAAPPPRGDREPGDLALGFVGRLLPSKGVDVLLRALVHVHGDWSLTVVGTGPSQEPLEGLSASLGIASRIHWLGALPPRDLATIWTRLACLVLPARTVPGEAAATGRVVLEAMARGIPAVVSDSGALPETVADTGIVVPESDEEALRAALQQLHDDAPHRAALGAAARRRVLGHYAPDAVARRTIELWDATLAGRAAAGAAR